MTILDSISQRHYFASKYPYRQSYGFSSSQVWIWELDHKAECQRIDAFELWCWKRLSRVLWTARRSDHYILRKSVLNIHWKDWCWSWNSNALATWCEELTHWKRPWSWEWLKAGREGDDRGWDGWMASESMDISLNRLRELVMDRESWSAAVHGFPKSQTRLNDWTELNDLVWLVSAPTGIWPDSKPDF